MTTHLLDAEIDANYDYFRGNLATFLTHHQNRYAVLRHQRIVEFYDEVAEADRAARTAFPDGLFSIQPVIEAPIDLGFFSHAGR